MHLKELGIDRNTTHPVFGSIEAELKQYTKLGYLETSKIRTGEGETNNYIWGSRAIVEFSESMIVRFITEVSSMFCSESKTMLDHLRMIYMHRCIVYTLYIDVSPLG